MYRFLHYRELPVDEYYDIVIFGYLAAVQEYDEKPGLDDKFQFSTIAWQKMSDCLCKHFTYINRPMRKAIAVSLYSEDTVSLDTMLPDRKHNVQDTVENRQYLLQLLSHLTNKEREVVFLKANGLSYSEIADWCGITPDGVGSRFARLRRRLGQILAA